MLGTILKWIDLPLHKVDKHCLLTWAVNILNFIFSIVEFFTDLAFGYTFRYGSKKEREEARRDGKDVHLVQIILRGAYGDTYVHTPQNFFVKHMKYVSTDYIVQNDKATLMGVTDKEFFFCITTNPQINVVDTAISPFMFALQFYMSEQLAIAPQNVIYKLADKIGDPKANVSILDMTGRCGSTLVCTMVTRVPECRVFSEPWVFLHAHRQFVREEISRETYKKLLKTIIRILCRKENETTIKHILIKLTIFLNCQIEILQEIYPDFKYMFISRHYKPCVKSWTKLTNTLPTYFVAKRSIMTSFFFENCPSPYGEEKWEKVRQEWLNWRGQPEDYMKCFTMNYIGEMASYMKFKDRYDHAMLYEDMMADPDGESQKLFKVMNLDEKYIPLAKAAFNFDSQKGKFGGRGTDHVVIPDKVWKDVNDLFKEYNMPLSTEMSMDEYRKIIYK